MFARIPVAKGSSRSRSAKTARAGRWEDSPRQPESVRAARSSLPSFSWNIGDIPVHAPDEPSQASARGAGGAALPAASLPWPMQAKLEVGAVSDPLEREADQAAQQVMRMPDAGAVAPPALPGDGKPGLRRTCSCGGTCAKCRGEHADEEHGPAHEDPSRLERRPTGPQFSRLGALAAGSGRSAPPSVQAVLHSPGRPLDAATRAFFEPRFGQDLSRIRQHSDPAAERSARDVGARAYTVGDRIVFGAGSFAPQTREGRHLLAHELAHAMQQRQGQLALHRQAAPDAAGHGDDGTSGQEDEEARLKLNTSRRNDTRYALSLGARDKARVEKKGLPAKLQQEITVTLRFFEGDAKAAYIRSMSTVLANYPDQAAEILAEPGSDDSKDAGAGKPTTCPGGAPPYRGVCLTDEALSTLGSGCDIAKKQFILQYEGQPELVKCLDISDPEFNNLFDSNITGQPVGFAVPGTTWENISYKDFKVMLVHYRNGKSEYFLLDDIGDFYYGPITLALRTYSYFKRIDTEMIYPIAQNRIYFSEVLTPNIMALKNGLKFQVKQLQQLYTELQVAGTFAQILSLDAAVGAESFKGAIEAFSEGGGGGTAARGSKPGGTSGEEEGTSGTAGGTGEKGTPQRELEQGGEPSRTPTSAKGSETKRPATTTPTADEEPGEGAAKTRPAQRDGGTEGEPQPKQEYANYNPRATEREKEVGAFLDARAQSGKLRGVKRVEGAPEIRGSKSGDYRFVQPDGLRISADLYETQSNDPRSIVSSVITKKGKGQAEIAVIWLGEGRSNEVSVADAQTIAHDVVRTPGHSLSRVIVIKGGQIVVDAGS